jgi:hypothetical protein
MGLFSLSHSNINREFGPPSIPSSTGCSKGLPGLLGDLLKSPTIKEIIKIKIKNVPVNSFFFTNNTN